MLKEEGPLGEMADDYLNGFAGGVTCAPWFVHELPCKDCRVILISNSSYAVDPCEYPLQIQQQQMNEHVCVCVCVCERDREREEERERVP